jgi:DNA topoisomerase IA
MISDNPVGVTWEPQKPKNGNPQLDKPLFTDRGVVESYKNALMSKASETYIHSYSETIEKEGAPNPFSLTDAQKIIGKACGTNATVTQVILEDLYEQGWTSYARTSKSELPINLYDPAERNDILTHLKNIPSLSSQATFAMDLHDGKISEHKPFVPKSFVRKDMEHYGIIPTKQVMTPTSFSALSPKKKKNGKMLHTAANMQKAYEMIAQRYIQMFYPPAEYGVQSVQINVPVRDILGNDESVFKTRGKRLISEGWKAAFPTRTKAADSTLPKMTKNDIGLLKQVNSKKGRTRPPARYNAISLPKELEMVGKDVADPKLRKLLQNAEGIGMPATRSTAIETVLARKYAITKNEDFYATNKGADLIRFVPKWLSTPETSAIWEEYLKKIESQKDDAIAIEMRDNFVNKQLERIEELITYMNNKFLGSLGDKIKPPPKKVSQKMKDLIKKLETQKNIKSPRGTLSDPLMAQAFIREHIQSGPSSSTDSYTPSEKQIALAKSIAKYLPKDLEVDESMYSDGKKLSDFISKNKKYSPPTAGQLKYLESIIAKLPAGTFVPEDARKYASECSAFINKHKKG